MARKLNFKVQIPGGEHRVSVRRFNELLSAELIVVSSAHPRCGQPADGVRAVLVDGVLQCYRVGTVDPSIPSSWRLIEQQAIYSDKAFWAVAGERERWIQEDYAPVLGANSYAIQTDSGVKAGV